ncbi:hypothetical protein LTR99_006857 [Exophiala xenobiotica]|uniref:BTB domain-containing protein n=1 Tax=Vermiconidia calcicola TaxID=1690605 RepID=A0AAV9Q2H6_9PEZI|nr:hypothetical protein LTR92_006676 [Exophiala xenobiotica]KAK5531853.1 hypothetical protein LTR25_008183 [Vermiconidia calcicola]KAK5542677.1 hypothetical protein LTR23_005287 [Chaetothyriales sp. CCFEE 6169]KAK5269423.1 hypothetical protein LTR96_005119 [Exophiala xenobiotica]KAK5300110.1 hypothetical protein LTR99_006857 [Exophiala xenobiotica]
MVSRAEVAERSQGPASVASRTSRSRHHHHRGRSHQGGLAQAPLNEFPFFTQSGDVEIVIACDGQEKKYLLHRFTLAQFSGFFEASNGEDWSRTQVVPHTRPDHALSAIGEESLQVSATPAAAQSTLINGPRRRWRYELDWESFEDNDDEPTLAQKTPEGALFSPSQPPPPPYQAEPQRRPRPQPAHTSFFRSMANLALSHHGGPASQSTAQFPVTPDPVLTNPLLRDYDNLFRIFYNYPPLLNATNIASAYSECKALLALADLYDALPVVGSRIDHHLLRFSSRLFKQIAKYPPSYLKLGYLARSRTIFSEALTHVVGQWPAALPYIRSPDPSGGGYEVPQSVIDLIEDKVDELEELKLRVETKLFRLTLTTSRGERVNPVNDYLGWLAMSLWRQWLAENTTPEVKGILKNLSSSSRPGSANTGSHTQSGRPSFGAAGGAGGGQTATAMAIQPPPTVNTGRIFRMIGSTNQEAFLPRDELKRFLKLQPPGHPSSSAVYTRDNLRRFERKIDEIKNVAQDLVKPLTRNCLELDLRSLSDGQGGGLGYLTCMKCEEGDIPWEI